MYSCVYPALHDSDLVQLLFNKLLQQFGDLISMSPECEKAKSPLEDLFSLQRQLTFRRTYTSCQGLETNNSKGRPALSPSRIHLMSMCLCDTSD